MHRTQIMLTDGQYLRLQQEASRTGCSLAELIRRALDERYGPVSVRERLRMLDAACGGWGGRSEDGEQLVERLRSGGTRQGARRES